MNRNTRASYIAYEATLAFEAFRKTHEYRPNEEEKVRILEERGFINALRVIRYLENLKNNLLKEIGDPKSSEVESKDQIILPASEGGVRWVL